MRIWFFFAFTFLFNFISSQTLDKNIDIDNFLKDKIKRDDVYDNDIRIRLDFVNSLDKKILINYIQTPDSLIKNLNKSEFEAVKLLYEIYERELKKMNDEFYYNSKVNYKSLTSKSRINNLLLVDELNTYPDSYSIIYNNELLKFKYSNLNKVINVLSEIFQKNENMLSGILNDVSNFKKGFVDKPLYYPTWEKPEIILLYNKINVVLWCYSNSEENFINLKKKTFGN
ncbi:hypothetical protein [Epilithonimonas hominis]|uniref:Uncharacterized protein n=1 Tax=Epilithonimonas hominis TaxID=420404 RepID=A0A1H6LGY8_9FLAO|nr:hypothetical protein [Epilithonimonas hominis]ROI13784.1 hypothetical protein EGH73_06705 [Epilithonimonas hominis]SEH85335.1 hypothetical protein SAMN05421793_1406 [Epilithonimonas hominis]